MPNCKFCKKPVKAANTFHSACWETQAEKAMSEFCDKYCRWPMESKDEDELHEAHCYACALVRLLNLGL